MENKKMKKIIFEAATIMLVTLILATNVQAETKKSPAEYEDDPVSQYNYFIISKGIAVPGTFFYMAINGDEYKIGKLVGDLYIKIPKGTKSCPVYDLFVFDKNTNKLLKKDTLPGEFTLKGFVGFGYIISKPNTPLLNPKWFITGKAIDLIE